MAFLCLGMEDTSGCASESSSNVNQDRIHTSYWILYDADADTTHGRAQFRLGTSLGTTLLLSEGASATFDDRPMGFDALLDWHSTSLAGLVDGGRFEYTDLEGDTFVNAAPPHVPVAVPDDFPPVVIRDGSSLELFWEGQPLAVGESMEAIVAHEANRFEFKRWDVRTPSATSVVLDGRNLAQLPAGGTVIQLRRWYETESVDAPSGGGVLRTTYQSPEVVFVLE